MCVGRLAMGNRVNKGLAQGLTMLVLAVLAGCATAPTPGKPMGTTRALSQTPRIIPGNPPLQCVPYARQQSGVQIWGDAHLWWAKAEGLYTRGDAPAVGSVLVLKSRAGAKRGHVAVVKSMPDRRTLIIDHANWQGRGEINKAAPVRDVSAKNDWSAVRVWHIPSGGWGRSVFQVQGFIYPEQRLANR